MTQLPLFTAAVEIIAVPAPIGFGTLFSGLKANFDSITGLFAFTVLAIAAIAWLTAAPSIRRDPAARPTAPGTAALV